MENSYIVMVQNKYEYAEVYKLVKNHGFEWQDEKHLEKMIEGDPLLWLVCINLLSRSAHLIVGITPCSCVCSRHGKKILQTKDVKYMLGAIRNESRSRIAQDEEYCGCVQDEQGSVTIRAKTLENLRLGQKATKYLLDSANAEKLATCIDKIVYNRDLDDAIRDVFLISIHFLPIFDGESFENFCADHDIAFDKAIEVGESSVD